MKDKAFIKQGFEITRSRLVAERMRLMDELEEQGDFPDPELIEKYEANKRKIIDLDALASMKVRKA